MTPPSFGASPRADRWATIADPISPDPPITAILMNASRYGDRASLASFSPSGNLPGLKIVPELVGGRLESADTFAVRPPAEPVISNIRSRRRSMAAVNSLEHIGVLPRPLLR
jgi:hypothetical protein